MLSFVSPWMLLGLLSISLPLIAHMVYSSQSRVLQFPSTRFITPARTPQTNTRKLSDILILILRILVIILITMAFSGLQWIPEESGQYSEEHIILLDNSASMNTEWKSREKMRLFGEIVENIEGAVALVTFGRESVQLIPLTTDKELISEAIEKISPVLDEGNPQKALQNSEYYFSTDVAARQLHVISDFQSSNWSNVSHSFGNSDIQLSLYPVNSATGKSGNTTVFSSNQTVISAEHSLASDRVRRVSVTLSNDGDEDVTRTLSLKVGTEEFEQVVEIRSRQVQQTYFEIPRLLSGKAEVAFASKDSYEMDDRLFFWLEEPPPVRTALVTPSTEPDRSIAEARFISTALLSQSDNDWQRFEFVKAPAEPGQSLTRLVDVLIFAGLPADITADSARDLRDFIDSGGLVLMSTGNGMAETLSLLQRYQLLSARYIGTGSKTRLDMSPFRLTAVKPESPLFNTFEGSAGNDLMLTRVYKYARMSLDDNAIVALHVDGKYPLIIDKKIGKGHLIFIGMRLDLSWSDLPLRPSFVPLIKELISPNIKPYQRLDLDVNEMLNEDGIQFTSDTPGLYVEQGRTISVNVSRNESNPHTLAKDQLIRSLGVSSSDNSKDFSWRKDFIKTDGEGSIQSLGNWLIAAAILLIIFESILRVDFSKAKANSA